MKTKIKRIVNNKFVRGSILLTSANLLANLLNYLFNLFVGRGLGPVVYGELATVFSYIFVIAAPLGVVNTMLVRKLGEAGEKRRRLASSLVTWFFIHLEKWGWSFVILFLLSPWLAKWFNLTLLSVVFLSVFALLAFINAIYLAVFNGLKFFGLIALLVVTAAIFKFLGALFVLWGEGNLTSIYSLMLIGSGVSLFISFRVFNKKVRVSTTKIDKRLWSVVQSPLFIQTTLVVLSLTLLSNLDLMFVKKFSQPVVAGWYGVWSLWAKVILYAIAPLSGLVLVFTSASEHQEKKHKFLHFSLISLFLVFLFVFVIYLFEGHFLIQAIYGIKFINIAPFLKLAAVFGFLYTLIHLFTNYYLAQKDKITLILPASIPPQIIFLYLNRSNFVSIMWVEILLSSVLATIYLVYWLLDFKLKT